MDIVTQVIDSGGAVALAVVIWAELRLFRKAMTDAMGTMVTKQTVILERLERGRTYEGNGVGFGNAASHR